MLCAGCGFTNHDDAKFCSMCGAPLEEKASPPLSTGSTPCPFCGEPNNDLVFCRFCGKKMSAGKGTPPIDVAEGPSSDAVAAGETVDVPGREKDVGPAASPSEELGAPAMDTRPEVPPVAERTQASLSGDFEGDSVRHESFMANIDELKPVSLNDAAQGGEEEGPKAEEPEKPKEPEEGKQPEKGPEPPSEEAKEPERESASSEEPAVDVNRRSPMQPFLWKFLIFFSLATVLFFAGIAIGLATVYLLRN